MLVPETNLFGAELLANRMRQRVEASPFKFGRHLLAMTVSIGVAALMHGGESGPAQLMQDADEAMYRAKSAGRNRVMVAPPRLGGGVAVAAPMASATIN